MLVRSSSRFYRQQFLFQLLFESTVLGVKLDSQTYTQMIYHYRNNSRKVYRVPLGSRIGKHEEKMLRLFRKDCKPDDHDF
jgi:hypothetical protein